MPAFNNMLNEMQMWQVSVLLSNADKPLPPDVLNTVKPPARSRIPESEREGATEAAPFFFAARPLLDRVRKASGELEGILLVAEWRVVDEVVLRSYA